MNYHNVRKNVLDINSEKPVRERIDNQEGELKLQNKGDKIVSHAHTCIHMYVHTFSKKNHLIMVNLFKVLITSY